MMAIAIHRTAIDQAYGVGAWDRTEPVLAAYTAGLDAAAIRWSAVFLDEPQATGLGGEPAGIGDVLRCVAIVHAETARKAPDAVLLIGGPDIVPMPRVKNRRPTLIADADPDIPTDNLYGCVQGDSEASPSIAVGRIGGAFEDGLGSFLHLLDQARLTRAMAQGPTGALVMSNRLWRPASNAVAKRILEQPITFLESPADQVDSSDPLKRSIVFFNLHGSRDESAWFGKNSIGNVFRCIRPESVIGGDLAGTLVFACNCYGGDLEGRASERSLALAMMQAGARAFIGATGYAFGALGGSGEVAFGEELARMFFDRLGAGQPAGVALCHARRAYATQRVKTGANRAYKTALQFVFLGDPLL